MKLVLYDVNNTYALRLKKAFLHDLRPVEILYFTTLQEAEDCLQREKPDAVLLTEALTEDFLEIFPEPSFPIFLLTDEKTEKGGKFEALFRYQKPERLYRAIFDHLSGLHNSIDSPGRSHAQTIINASSEISHSMPILWVSSAIGGVGTTSIACACAIAAARRGKAVLYLNFDGRMDPQRYFGGLSENSMSDVIYRLKRGVAAEDISMLFGEGQDGVYYFGRCRNFLDASELQRSDQRILFEQLSASPQIDAVVLDHNLPDGTSASFFEEESDQLLFISDGRETTDTALDDIWRDLRAAWGGKAETNGLLLYNRCQKGAWRKQNTALQVMGFVSDRSSPPSLRRLSEEIAVEEVVNRWLSAK